MKINKLHEDDYIENTINSLDESDINQFLKENNSYEYHYFLSELRHSLLEWYPFKQEASLLEIGSGYGQLTGLFTQKVSDVTAVEDSESKAEIVSKRAKDAKVIVRDFNELETEDKFDYIILCNVFEYAKSFMDSENPYADYLKYLKGFLKRDGVILLALSNRLGLKYFAGFKEEHTNQFFAGIDGFGNESNAETFTREELTNIILSAGFENYKFFYPYPDHEFPNVIHTDKFINEKPYFRTSNYFDEKSNLFREDKLNQTLARSNLAGFFANSFLVEIRNSNNTYPCDEIDFVGLDLDRKDEFKSVKTISNDNVCMIQSSGEFNELKENIDFIFGKIKYLPCEISGNTIKYPFPGESVESQLIQCIYRNDEDGFLEIVEDFYNALIFNSTESKGLLGAEFKAVFKKSCKKEFHFHGKSSLDLTLDNIYKIDKAYYTTGYEWLFEFPIPLEYIFFRVINHHVNSNVLFKEFITVREIFHHLNLRIEDLDLFAQWEEAFSEYVFGELPLPEHKIIPRENLDYAEKMDEYLISNYILENANYNKSEQLKRDIVVNQRNIIKQKNELIKAKEMELEEKCGELKEKDNLISRKNAQIRKKNNKIKEYSQSRSWKITGPLRKLGALFRR